MKNTIKPTKTICFLFVSFFSLFLMGYAQDKQEQDHHKTKREKIKALKIAFITEELKLTSEEAEEFWPIYNKYEQAKQRFHKEKRTIYLSQIKNKDLSEIDENRANNLLKKLNFLQKELLESETNFYQSIKSVLSSKKILILKISEEKFHRKLMHEFKKGFHNKKQK